MITQSNISNTNNIHEFFIFNRSGVCIFHLDFQDKTIINKSISFDKMIEHRYKLIFGLLFSMKSFVKNLSPVKAVDILKSFITINYKLHYVDFVNGLRFVMISAPLRTDFSSQLKEIFSIFYVNLISKNISINKEEPLKNELFLEGVHCFLNSFNLITLT